MDVERFRGIAFRSPVSRKTFPLVPDTLVFRVVGKIFALCDVHDFDGINLKCDPERAIELRDATRASRPATT
jgi:predicted DNA-binding protein (MmcQ/YjbR family)